MKKLKIVFLFAMLNAFISTSFAWNHSLEIGAGISHDPNNTRYNNYGLLISGDIFPLKRTAHYFWSIGGALGQWHTNSPQHKNLTTIAIPLSLRYYLGELHCYPAYVFGSVGPAYMSSRQFGKNKQASNLSGQWNLGVGAEFHKIDLNLRFQHFSNAHLGSPDQGFSVLYLLSIGYLF